MTIYCWSFFKRNWCPLFGNCGFCLLIAGSAFKKLKTFILREIARFDGPIIRSHLDQEFLIRNFRRIATGETRWLRIFFGILRPFNCCLLLWQKFRVEKLRNSKECSKYYVFGPFILLYVFDLWCFWTFFGRNFISGLWLQRNPSRILTDTSIKKAVGFATEMFRYSTSL